MFETVERVDLVSRLSSQLSQAIIEGRIMPGSRLNEVRLSQEFQVSRAPLREALRLLENQGLVEAHPRRGFFLREITQTSTAELFDVRMALECAAGSRLARIITDDQVKLVEAQYASLRDAALAGDEAATIEQDFEFHRLLCELSGNERLQHLIEQISGEIRFTIMNLRGIQPDLLTRAEAHWPLVEALKQRDADKFVFAMQRHLGNARDSLCGALEQQLGGFNRD